MGLKISGLNELRERLERLRPEEVMARALAEQAQRMAARVREGLLEQPGTAGHDKPWLQSGALRDSVGGTGGRAASCGWKQRPGRGAAGAGHGAHAGPPVSGTGGGDGRGGGPGSGGRDGGGGPGSA